MTDAGAGLSFAQILAEIEQPEGIGPATVRRVFDSILAGAWSPEKIAGLLIALRLKGESAGTIRSAAEAMRSAMSRVPHRFSAVLDTCGTGGDGHNTVNISTGAAIIASACGVVVAKHGNRAASSKCGTADVLLELGLPIDLKPEASSRVLAAAEIAFLMAPVHHPAMRFAGPVRRELGVRTIFNCLGPLANPAGATHQLIGAYEDRIRPLMAQALAELGSVRAWVVRGVDGLDEISPSGPTRITELASGMLREFEVTPEDFGIPRIPLSAIAGGDATENAAAIRSVLRGEPHPAAPAFLLNAAAALVVAKDLGPKQAAELARAAIQSGAALRKLELWQTEAAAAAAAANPA